MQPAPAATRVRIEFAQESDPGRDPNKQVNEDSCGYAETKFGHLVVLCDGMGGHYGGKEASRLAIQTIFEVVEQMPLGTPPVAALKGAVEEAGRRVYRLGGPPENRTRPGSTVVSMILHDRGVDVCHVGDSRAYVIRSAQIYPLTRDHSMVQGMIDAGMLTEQQAIGHPDSNKITRALGMKPEVDVEARPEPMELYAGDVFLLCSDGLTDVALGADVLACAKQAMNASAGMQNVCKALVAMANERGGPDNVTVQIARVIEVAQKGVTTVPGAPMSGGAQPGGMHGAPQRAPQAAPAGQGGVLETIPMTRADGGAPPAVAITAQSAGIQPRDGQRPPPAAGAPHQGVGATPAWAPPAPTINEGAPPSSGKPWASGMYQPPASLQAYRMDAGNGPSALPLPPSSRNHGQAGPTQLTPAPAGGVMTAPWGGGSSSMPPSMSYSGGPPSRSGIVVVIIGLSAVIAVLLLLLIWALLR